jgi:hypothetical protein
MKAFIASGIKELPKTSKLVLAQDEGRARRIMAAQGDKFDERWMSHDYASMDEAPVEMAGVLDVPVTKGAKEAAKAST